MNETQQEKYRLEIEKLMKNKGGFISAKELLKHAKAKSSPLHDFFDWDDSIASRKWREHQARLLLGSIVELVEIEEKKERVRSFFNVKDVQGKSVYVTRSKVLSNKRNRKQLVNRLIEHMEETKKLLLLFNK